MPELSFLLYCMSFKYIFNFKIKAYFYQGFFYAIICPTFIVLKNKAVWIVPYWNQFIETWLCHLFYRFLGVHYPFIISGIFMSLPSLLSPYPWGISIFWGKIREYPVCNIKCIVYGFIVQSSTVAPMSKIIYIAILYSVFIQKSHPTILLPG